MSTLMTFAALVVLGWLGSHLVQHYRKWRRKQREGWRLVSWRRLGYGYELHFHNGTIVRNRYYYPSGQFISVHDSICGRIQMLEKQLEFGQHRELEIKDAHEAEN